jgi:RimJ/RimL family protein N-acetyltransferase
MFFSVESKLEDIYKMVLREFVLEDKGRLLEILNDSDVTKYLSTKISQPYTSEDADWWITEGSKLSLVRAIEVDEKLVGCIGVNRGEFEYCRSGEIGYWLASDFWRRGIATNAINEMLLEVFLTTDIIRIFASVFDGNVGSMKVLEKCGFAFEAIQPKAIFKENTFYDSHVFAIQKT